MPVPVPAHVPVPVPASVVDITPYTAAVNAAEAKFRQACCDFGMVALQYDQVKEVMHAAEEDFSNARDALDQARGAGGAGGGRKKRRSGGLVRPSPLKRARYGDAHNGAGAGAGAGAGGAH